MGSGSGGTTKAGADGIAGVGAVIFSAGMVSVSEGAPWHPPMNDTLIALSVMAVNSHRLVIGIFYWFFLLLFFVSLMIAVSTQIIGVLLLLPIFIFIVFYAVYVFNRVELKTFLVCKYFVVPTCAVLLFVIVYILLPQINSILKEGLTYIPSFAKNIGALDRTRFLKYIMGKDIFPIGVFFALGTVQAVLRMNKVILYSVLFFIVQVYLFTFVFS